MSVHVCGILCAAVLALLILVLVILLDDIICYSYVFLTESVLLIVDILLIFTLLMACTVNRCAVVEVVQHVSWMLFCTLWFVLTCCNIGACCILLFVKISAFHNFKLPEHMKFRSEVQMPLLYKLCLTYQMTSFLTL